MQPVRIRDGKLYNNINEVAVAISSGYGSGWSTWSSVDPMWGEFNLLIYEEKIDKAIVLAKKNDFCTLGVQNITLAWLVAGTQFEITVYDGYETLKEYDNNILIA